MLGKLKNLSINNKITLSGPVAPVGHAPDKALIYRNRNNFGVNLGSVFVLEKFMFGDYFINDSKLELDAVQQLIKSKGEDGARKLLEDHWTHYMDDNDWKWLQSKGVTAVRIPIGYWAVDGGKFAADTSFSKVAKVYQNAWKYYRQYIDTAAKYNIAVLVDLHALPKGANTGDHSGEVLSKAGFWDSHSSQKILVDVVTFMAKDLRQVENIAGLQIVNESEFNGDGAAQKHYYTKAINAIRQVDPIVPIIISDGWWPDQWVKWISEEEKKLGKYETLGVVIDSHCYRCFSDDDKKKAPENIIDDLQKDLLTNLSAPLDILVGEYSCVLDGDSWNKTKTDRSQLVTKYGQAQMKQFKQRANCGSYFWTYKFQYGDGGEWGFRPMVDSNAIPARSRQVQLPSKQQFDDALNHESSSHENYWNGQNPHEKYEHYRYKDGFNVAWADAMAFAQFEGSQLGRLHAWYTARLKEHINARGDSNFIWEFEQGFNKSIEIFNKMVFGI